MEEQRATAEQISLARKFIREAQGMRAQYSGPTTQKDFAVRYLPQEWPEAVRQDAAEHGWRQCVVADANNGINPDGTRMKR